MDAVCIRYAQQSDDRSGIVQEKNENVRNAIMEQYIDVRARENDKPSVHRAHIYVIPMCQPVGDVFVVIYDRLLLVCCTLHDMFNRLKHMIETTLTLCLYVQCIFFIEDVIKLLIKDSLLNQIILKSLNVEIQIPALLRCV